MASASRSIVSLSLVLAACGHAPGSPSTAEVVVAVLPEDGGKVGAVVVHPASGGPTVLNSAYAGARLRGASKVEAVTLDQAQVDRTFGPALSALPMVPVSYTVYFLEGSDELTPESHASLNRIAAELANRSVPEVVVIGHTDLVGNDQYNDALSTQRAQRVRDELVRAHVPADRIEVAARGKREPLFRTAEGVADPRNRRVEISVR
ncbi:MAG TPA: OmpA family protein [Burkholderiales bacterium]|nr:OmpA family protein [Burkholderiales bacterium]